jgi:hypothetical protein
LLDHVCGYNEEMAFNIKAYTLALFLIAVVNVRADDTISINNEMVFNHLVGNYQYMMTLADVPKLTKKLIAWNTYGLMFACWLDKDNRSIAKGYTRIALKMVEYSNRQIDSKDPISYDDPMRIEEYYENGRLAGDGPGRCEWLPVKNAGILFAREDKYKALVRDFRSWQEGLK